MWILQPTTIVELEYKGLPQHPKTQFHELSFFKRSVLSSDSQLPPQFCGSSLATFTLCLHSFLAVKNGEFIISSCQLTLSFIQGLGDCDKFLE